ncbi:2-amino-4-hydroxy-6-hydroxymethyldihydropteridine diphosphokinase [Vibrio sp.]|uniref:2-amino-4-hydroxy-6- hydroxymethyldihydropteridine diphosphokinase n=1 Tax=Vibrio sp. TaxID=678 RepID=UPI003D0B6A9E
MITTYIGVGSNIDRRKHVEAAVAELSALGTVRLSTIYQCESVGFAGQPFYNLVVELCTELAMEELHSTLRDIELRWGRAADARKFQDRTLDLDLILYGEQTNPQAPQLPRPDIYKYAFVIQPLFELCPQLVVPGDGRTIQEIKTGFSQPEPLEPVPLWFDVSHAVRLP